MTIWRPLVPSVSSSDDGEAVVVNATDARSWLPVLDRSNDRWIVSPGTSPEAFTVSRFVDAPVFPRAMTTVPDATVWLALVVAVKVANVPMPARAPATPSAPRVSSSFRPVPPKTVLIMAPRTARSR